MTAFFKVTLLALVLLRVSGAQAVLISHHGYTLDTNTNIVTGGGLEWLQWDQTVGQSIDTALASLGASGWRVASNAEMAALFNAFSFGLTFTSDENTNQQVDVPWDAAHVSPHLDFIELFGDTYATAGNSCCGQPQDPLQLAGAIFGADTDQDGFYNWAIVRDDYISPGLNVPSRANLRNDNNTGPTTSSSTVSTYGVALVRNSQVPLPAGAWLFLSSLGVLRLISSKQSTTL